MSRPVDSRSGLKLSSAVTAVAAGGSDAWRVHYAGLAMEQAGEDVIVLSVGDPDFDTPSDIVEAAVSALRGGDTHYTIAGGAGPLADAIAADESARLGSTILPGEVVATLGAQNGLYTLFHCLLEPGDEAILLAPAYSMFPGVIGSCGARVVTVPLDQSRGFALDIDALVNAMTPDTRAVLANFPHNPSGAFPDVETTRALIDLCAERGCWLVSDEAYSDLCYDGQYVSPRALSNAPHIVVIRSLSKTHAMTGWRIGWVITGAPLASHLRNFLNHVTYGAPSFIQAAGICALTGEHGEVARMRDSYRERRDRFVAALATAPALRVVVPRAGIFCLIDVSATGLGGEAFADRLLAAEKVSVLPGGGFDPCIQHCVRVALTQLVERLEEAAGRIARFAATL